MELANEIKYWISEIYEKSMLFRQIKLNCLYQRLAWNISASSVSLGDDIYSTICITVIRELGIFIQAEGRVWRDVLPDGAKHNTSYRVTLTYGWDQPSRNLRCILCHIKVRFVLNDDAKWARVITTEYRLHCVTGRATGEITTVPRTDVLMQLNKILVLTKQFSKKPDSRITKLRFFGLTLMKMYKT